MWLQQDTVDLLQVDGLGAIAHGFQERSHAQVSSSAKHSLRRPHDEGERVVSESVVGESNAVELSTDKISDDIGRQFV